MTVRLQLRGRFGSRFAAPAQHRSVQYPSTHILCVTGRLVVTHPGIRQAVVPKAVPPETKRRRISRWIPTKPRTVADFLTADFENEMQKSRPPRIARSSRRSGL